MPAPSPTRRALSPEEVLPVFRTFFSRALLRRWLHESQPTTIFYWRLFTPLIVLWCLIVQRLQPDHRCDAVVSHLHSGAADGLDPADPHPQPLSYRLRSESSSAYVQAPPRLPLALIQAANRHLVTSVQRQVAAEARPSPWHAYQLRWLDGTTYRLAPTPELVALYGQARNQHGTTYWLVVRSVACFCATTQVCVAQETAPPTTSESAMVAPLMAADGKGTIFVGDIAFGVEWVAQVARAHQQHVLLRLKADRFAAMRRMAAGKGPRRATEEWALDWAWRTGTKAEPS